MNWVKHFRFSSTVVFAKVPENLAQAPFQFCAQMHFSIKLKSLLWLLRVVVKSVCRRFGGMFRVI